MERSITGKKGAHKNVETQRTREAESEQICDVIFVGMIVCACVFM